MVIPLLALLLCILKGVLLVYHLRLRVIGTQVFAAFHQLRRVAPSALGLFCFLVILWLALGNGAGEFARSGSVCPSFTLMPSKSCCSCHPGKQNTCVNCACAKKGLACTKCYLSQAGKCLNPFGTGHVEVKAVSCPFEGCSSTGRSTMRIRAVADSWLEANDSIMFMQGPDHFEFESMQ